MTKLMAKEVVICHEHCHDLEMWKLLVILVIMKENIYKKTPTHLRYLPDQFFNQEKDFIECFRQQKIPKTWVL